MVDSHPRRIVLPGMGGDERMYAGVDWGPGAVELLRFPDDDRFPTLGDCAAHLIKRYALTTDDLPVGTSLGGMVALEIAQQLHCAQVVLNSSCTHPRAINPLLFRLAPLGARFAWTWLQRSLRHWPFPVKAKEITMFLGYRPAYYQWACAAVAAWPGVTTFAGRIHHLHGIQDPVISARQATVTMRVPGRHLIAMQQPELVSRLMAEVRASAAGHT